MVLFIPTLLILKFLLNVEWKVSLLISLGYSLILGFIITQMVSKKFEHMLGKLYYISTLFYENKEKLEDEILPIPIYEEMTEILENFEKSIKYIRENYLKSIKELEEEYTDAVEKASTLISLIEELREGNFQIDKFPTGLDPIGALGEALKETMKELYLRIKHIEELVYNLEDEVKNLHLLIESGAEEDFIKRKLDSIESIVKKIQDEIEFFR